MQEYKDLRAGAVSRWEAQQKGELPLIYLGTASCGRAAGAMDVLQAVQETLASAHLSAHIIQVGCIGPCYLEPLMDIALPGQPRVSYARVTPEKAKKIVAACLGEGDLMPRLAAGHLPQAPVFIERADPPLARRRWTCRGDARRALL